MDIYIVTATRERNYYTTSVIKPFAQKESAYKYAINKIRAFMLRLGADKSDSPSKDIFDVFEAKISDSKYKEAFDIFNTYALDIISDEYRPSSYSHMEWVHFVHRDDGFDHISVEKHALEGLENISSSNETNCRCCGRKVFQEDVECWFCQIKNPGK